MTEEASHLIMIEKQRGQESKRLGQVMPIIDQLTVPHFSNEALPYNSFHQLAIVLSVMNLSVDNIRSDTL
jgi:hypothetical protein